MAKKESCTECSSNPRLNKVGGQAVLEGVMMKAGKRTVTSCRKEDGSITVNDGTFVSVKEKHRALGIPLLRGVVNFIEMLILSFKTLNISAEALEIDDERDKERKAEGKKTTTDIVMIIGLIGGLLLAVGLFILLPGYTSDLIVWIFSKFGVGINVTVKAVIEGAVKIVIFVAYLALVSLMPDIKRTFMYHGAEHKSIACFEAGVELTPENAKNYTRFHPRCGTSFMFVMILLGIIVGIIVNNVFAGLPRIALSAIRLLILPLVVGIGYEFIMFAGKHPNPVTRALSAPGLWMQRITTKEPTEDMLEIAICSIKCALRDDYPEFSEFFESKAWEKRDSDTADTADGESAEIPADASTADNAAIPADVSTADNAEIPADASTADSADADGAK